MTGPVYALNLFDVSNKDEYLAHLFDKLTDLRLILK